MPAPTATVFVPYHALDEVHQRGTRAAQPPASAVVAGTLYFVTDEGVLERSDGTSWASYAGTGGGGGGAPAPHHTTHETSGTDAIAALSGAVITSGTVAAARLGAHHTTHETGGTDAIAALDAAVLTTGTVASARLPATMPPAPHHTTHEAAGSDALSVQNLGGFIGNTTVFLRGDAAWATPPAVPTAHHATHETGGSDPIASLSASVLTSGTVADARLSANVALLNTANVFTQDQRVQKAAPVVRWTDTAAPANARVFRIYNTSQRLVIDAVSDDESTSTVPLVLQRSGDITVGQNLYEKGRATPMGHWTPIPFNAANFAAQAGAWTVTAGQVLGASYQLVGKTCTLSLYVYGSSISAATPYLSFLLPSGITVAAGNNYAVGCPYMNVAAVAAGIAQVAPSSSTSLIFLYRDIGASQNWQAGTVSVAFTLPFQLL